MRGLLNQHNFSHPATEPNVDSPLNGQAAVLWARQAEYKDVLLKHYQTEVLDKAK